MENLNITKQPDSEAKLPETQENTHIETTEALNTEESDIVAKETNDAVKAQITIENTETSTQQVPVTINETSELGTTDPNEHKDHVRGLYKEQVNVMAGSKETINESNAEKQSAALAKNASSNSIGELPKLIFEQMKTVPVIGGVISKLFPPKGAPSSQQPTA